MAEEDFSPFTEREQILRSIGSVIGIRLHESDLSKATLEKIDNLASIKTTQAMKRADSHNYFIRVSRYWILFFLLLILGVFLAVFLVGLVLIAIDVLLYRWIRKRERTTPQSSRDALELAKSYTADLVNVFNIVKAELPASKLAVTTGRRETVEISDLIGRAVWVEMDADRSGTVFKPRRGIVVKVFTLQGSGREALAIELAPPPFSFFPVPRRLRYLIAEYYQKWDSIQYTFNRGHSYVKYLRLKNKAILKSQSYGENDVSPIGCGLLSVWPTPSSDEMLLRKQPDSGPD
jgi:hypothetical protein